MKGVAGEDGQKGLKGTAGVEGEKGVMGVKGEKGMSEFVKLSMQEYCLYVLM